MEFKLVSTYEPTGDQPQAIEELREGISRNTSHQTLLGVTGSGKTFTIANIIDSVNKPTLVISHNKTLAAQLYQEFKEFFPYNAVEYFVSYYDYYQPEAYISQTDTYIEKDASINEELDKLRLRATAALMMRKDVIVVASVSCIYNLGSPQEYKELFFELERAQIISRKDMLRSLIEIQYERNDTELKRGSFCVRGDVIEIHPTYDDKAIRVEFDDDEVKNIETFDVLTRNKISEIERLVVYPAKHFVTTEDRIESALVSIENELELRLKELKKEGKLLEFERLKSRTRYDMEMLREVGYCHGIENYSRHLSSRPQGMRPYCLIDYLGDDFLTIIDESHVAIPQLRGMYNGDRARKQNLVDFGFRLPSCLENRPLKFKEFENIIHDVIFVSATPSEYEIKKSDMRVVEQIIRPTGLLDPAIVVNPSKGQIENLVTEIKKRSIRCERTIVTTLTKRMAEDLSDYLEELGVKVQYLHSEINTIERVKILKALRLKEIDCIVGINLLREGLDLPEVSLVAILDADKEGFLRSFTSLIQVAGRAARNVNGKVIMYADNITDSMKKVIFETERRRTVQSEYNKKHHITPATVKKAIRNHLESYEEAKKIVRDVSGDEDFDFQFIILELYREMETAARNLQFEKAASIRDMITNIKKEGKIEGVEGMKILENINSSRRKYGRWIKRK
ncbi:MAG: excinuclease ABC subunit UvrB [Candidatus Saelkia tenebricola]|nr:excinuclease ABC subunit UvrB [Candidatus Saelkia tenebricola]